MLAGEAGMQVPEQSPREIAKAKQEKSLYSLMEDATRWMEDQLRLSENKGAYRYILERGNDEELLRNFRVGYAPHDGQAIRKAMQALEYTDKQMIECGVLRAGKSGREPYAFFRERIMFPVPDRRGRVVAFGGRTLPDHLLMPNQGDYTPAKYMNSSETPLFHKGSMLYGEPHARQAALDGQPLVVVEGYIDVMASFKADYRGALAPMGTALTEEQIVSLWRMIPEGSKSPVLCFDGDNAGRRAASRACERLLPLLKPDHSARFAFLPDGQDPDSLVNGGGKKAFASVIEAAMPLVEFLWQHHTQSKNFDTPEAQAGLSKTLEEEVLRIADRDVQHYYRQALRGKVRETFGNTYKKGSSSKFSNYKKPYVPQDVTPMRRPSFSRRLLLEQVLVAGLINHPEIIDIKEEMVGALVLKETRLDQLRQEILSQWFNDSEIELKTFHNNLKNNGFEADIKGILSENTYTHAPFIRAKTDINDVLQGWENALMLLNQDDESRKNA